MDIIGKLYMHICTAIHIKINIDENIRKVAFGIYGNSL